jgi:hypothetical protein
MKSRSQIVGLYALAALFTIFNVGLPIVQYVCPMMRGGTTCECKTLASREPAVSFPQGGCCNSHLLAERNTTPFLGSGKERTQQIENTFILASATLGLSQPSETLQMQLAPDTGPLHTSNAVYLLSSPLLI